MEHLGNVRDVRGKCERSREGLRNVEGLGKFSLILVLNEEHAFIEERSIDLLHRQLLVGLGLWMTLMM